MTVERQRLQWRQMLGVAGLLALLLCAVGVSRAAAPRLLNQPAPDFALKSLAGPNLRLSEYLGQVVLVNFWASWCGPCRQEMPALETLHNTYHSAGLVLLGVNVDAEKDRQRAEEFIRTLKLSYPMLFDTKGRVGDSYGLSKLPMTVLIDRTGTVRQVYRDYKPGAEREYVVQLRALLNE